MAGSSAIMGRVSDRSTREATAPLNDFAAQWREKVREHHKPKPQSVTTPPINPYR